MAPRYLVASLLTLFQFISSPSAAQDEAAGSPPASDSTPPPSQDGEHPLRPTQAETQAQPPSPETPSAPEDPSPPEELTPGSSRSAAERGVERAAPEEAHEPAGPWSLEAAYDRGFKLATKEKGLFSLSIGGVAHVDARFFFEEDGADALADTFVVRRARPVVSGTVFKYFDLFLMPDFGQGRPQLVDAYADVHFVPWARVRIGKMKSPVGLERLQPITATHFVELGLPSQLSGNRDIGVQVHGAVAEGALTYNLGVFDGVAGGASTDGDLGDGKDVAARLFAHPLRPTNIRWVKEIGLGIAGTYGERLGTQASTELSPIRSSGPATIFQYRSGASLAETVVADGYSARIVPQAYAYVGPAGALFEYAWAKQRVSLDDRSNEFETWSWMLAATVVLTGEDATHRGVEPRHPVGVRGGYGAVELAGRYAEINTPDQALILGYADPASSASLARAWAIAITYHFNYAVKLTSNFERTTFEGLTPGAERAAENAFLHRIQVVL